MTVCKATLEQPSCESVKLQILLEISAQTQSRRLQAQLCTHCQPISTAGYHVLESVLGTGNIAGRKKFFPSWCVQSKQVVNRLSFQLQIIKYSETRT